MNLEGRVGRPRGSLVAAESRLEPRGVGQHVDLCGALVRRPGKAQRPIDALPRLVAATLQEVAHRHDGQQEWQARVVAVVLGAVDQRAEALKRRCRATLGELDRGQVVRRQVHRPQSTRPRFDSLRPPLQVGGNTTAGCVAPAGVGADGDGLEGPVSGASGEPMRLGGVASALASDHRPVTNASPARSSLIRTRSATSVPACRSAWSASASAATMSSISCRTPARPKSSSARATPWRAAGSSSAPSRSVRARPMSPAISRSRPATAMRCRRSAPAGGKSGQRLREIGGGVARTALTRHDGCCLEAAATTPGSAPTAANARCRARSSVSSMTSASPGVHAGRSASASAP